MAGFQAALFFSSGLFYLFSRVFAAVISRAIVYGPAIEVPKLVLPARYFFVQLVDEHGMNITESQGKDAIDVRIWSQSGPCSFNHFVYDAFDGSYNVRLVLRETCANLLVGVFSKSGKLLSSKYLLKDALGTLDADICDCPMPVEEWKATARCRQDLFKFIDEDLAPWPEKSVDFKYVIDEVERKWGWQTKGASLVHYRIRENKIFKKTYGHYVGFSEFSDKALLSITRKVWLPDVDFVLNLGDWPLELRRRQSKPPVPIIAWCGSADSLDIVLPSYEVMLNTLKTDLSYNQDLLKVSELRQVSWKNKTSKAFWRGRDSRKERLLLVNISRSHPDLLDAALTHFFFFNNDIPVYGPAVATIPFQDFFKYKYQVNVDGTVAAYRLTLLLAGNSLVLKQDSDYYEHYYRGLQQGVHYVPFKADLSNLLEKIKWAKRNPKKVLKIISNAHTFLKDNVMPREIYCYNIEVLLRYKKILQHPLLNFNMSHFEKVAQQPSKKQTRCSCVRKIKQDEEL
ncbi:KDEL motif containing protein 1 [Trichuris trichiura]|uniref:KDEL motif containing protein 1 n=1 Tax=Trichuris trichiura TaxID=36087 RepID=A0A077Z4J2_TRITR|nr:KDEL motif containing protein 1 [Trichuris trichiura]